METKRIKADVAYATCDGKRIVFKTVEKSYLEEHGKIVKVEVTDPWGGCMSMGRPRRAKLKALHFDVDGDDEPIGEGSTLLVNPTDVKGTWAEFMSLYADRIKRQDDHRKQVKRRNEIEAEITRKVRALFPDLSVYVSTKSSPDDSRYGGRISITQDIYGTWENFKNRAAQLGLELTDEELKYMVAGL